MTDSHGTRFPRLLILTAAAGIVFLQAAGAQTLGVAPAPPVMLEGAVVSVGGQNVRTWATIDASGAPVEVGVTVSYGLLAGPPEEPGTGPAGAVAVAAFPAAVQKNSVFNHFEIHWEPHGHTPDVFLVPHFDLHFYRMTAEEVAAITAPDAAPPAATRLPKGFVYGGAQTFVPQMGVHSLDPADLGKPFTAAVLILGYHGGELTFVEPMMTQDSLKQKKDFSIDIPAPAELGEPLYFPSRFVARYDRASDSYRFVMSGFTRSGS